MGFKVKILLNSINKIIHKILLDLKLIKGKVLISSFTDKYQNIYITIDFCMKS